MELLGPNLSQQLIEPIAAVDWPQNELSVSLFHSDLGTFRQPNALCYGLG
jgi:hypothetical protein